MDVRSGDRLGDHLAIELGGELDRRPKDAFYGIGNDGRGIEGRHRQQLLRTTAVVDVRAISDLHARFGGALSELGYSTSDEGMPIDVVYDPMQLVGWTGVRNTYGELELRWDSRTAGSPWEIPSLLATGTLASAFAGRVHQFGALSDYWRYGVDLQHFTRLAVGPRVLVTRLHAEAVSEGDVAFTELPQLGGKALLRGYPADRFRDRVAVLGSVEYQWDLTRHTAASLFVDAGRVYGDLDELSFENLRLGYGIGLQLQTTNSFVAEASLASSKDGGLFLNVAFDPVFRISPREQRR